MRWILLAAATIGLLLILASRSLGWMVLGVALFLIGGFGAALVTVQARIDANARPESLDDWQVQQLRVPPSDASLR